MKARKKALKQINDKKQGKLNKANTVRGAGKTAGLKVPRLQTPKAPFKKTEFFNILAEQANLSKKEVKGVLEAIKVIAKVHLVKAGPGQFTLPGLCKLTAVNKPATKSRKGRNPFTGEEMTFKAKPARRVVKIKLLKKFKAELE